MALFASFTSVPAPGSPRWKTFFPKARSRPSTRSKAAREPLAITVSVPCAAPIAPPETGASTSSTPAPTSSSASRRTIAHELVERSTWTSPRRAPARIPASPRTTDSTSTGPGSEVITTRQRAATSRGLAALRAPASASGRSASGRRSWTTSACPASSSRRAIGAPIVPTPMKPTSSAPATRRSRRPARGPVARAAELGGKPGACRGAGGSPVGTPSATLPHPPTRKDRGRDGCEEEVSCEEGRCAQGRSGQGRGAKARRRRQGREKRRAHRRGRGRLLGRPARAPRQPGLAPDPLAVSVRIPERGVPREEVLARLERFREHDLPWRDGRTFAYVYDPGREAEAVIKEAFASYLSENALDPTVFPSALRLENEVVAMAAAHLGGGADVVGSFTSGGTESILLAVKAARDLARAERPGIAEPEMVLPETAHASFQKAGHYLGVRPVLAPVDPGSFRADPDAVRAAITPRTILLVGSAVSYAHGVVDPIPELGAIAAERGLPLHVDACIGGFLLPYFRRLGSAFPDFDFRVPGVSSISMDLHKYAFAAKGASTLLYRSAELRRHQIYACASWSGYTVINTTVQSTKSAGPLAAAWAALHFIGDDGYLEIARKVRDATARIVAGIDATPELRVLGRPDTNLVAFASDGPGVFHIADEMKERGWYLQPQLAFGSSPENLHLSVNPASVHLVDALLADLRECVEKARALPTGALGPRIRAAFGEIRPQDLDEETFRGLLAMAGVGSEGLPRRMAEINEVLNALPAALRERLLVEYLNGLYAQPDRRSR